VRSGAAGSNDCKFSRGGALLPRGYQKVEAIARA